MKSFLISLFVVSSLVGCADGVHDMNDTTIISATADTDVAPSAPDLESVIKTNTDSEIIYCAESKGCGSSPTPVTSRPHGIKTSHGSN